MSETTRAEAMPPYITAQGIDINMQAGSRYPQIGRTARSKPTPLKQTSPPFGTRQSTGSHVISQRRRVVAHVHRAAISDANCDV
jgi:hypothetical protein